MSTQTAATRNVTDATADGIASPHGIAVPDDVKATGTATEATTPIEACPSFVAAMTIIGQRWSGLIIQALAKGCTSFTEISHFAEKLSDASLSRRLKQLEAQGLLVRTVTQDRPTRVRYTLTEAGRALAPVLNALTDWGERYVRHGNVTPPAHRSRRA